MRHKHPPTCLLLLTGALAALVAASLISLAVHSHYDHRVLHVVSVRTAAGSSSRSAASRERPRALEQQQQQQAQEQQAQHQTQQQQAQQQAQQLLHQRQIPRILHVNYMAGPGQLLADALQPLSHFRKEWWLSCRTHHPGWRFVFWDAPACEALLQQRYPWFLPTWALFKNSTVLRSDAIQPFILHAHGAGGWLSSHSLATAAWAAAAGSLLAFVVVAVGLPADAPKSAAKAGSQQAGKALAFNAANLIAAARCPGVAPLLAAQAGAGLAGAVFQSTFSLVLQQQYQLTSKQNGFVLSYVGVCIVFGQAVVIKQVTKGLGEAAAVKAGCAVLALSFLGIGAAAGRLWQLLVWLAPMAAGSVMVVTVNQAALTKAVPSHMAGSIMALDMSMSSGLRTLSPLIGTWLLQHYGYSVVCVFSVSVLGAVLLLQLLLPVQQQCRSSHKKDD